MSKLAELRHSSRQRSAVKPGMELMSKARRKKWESNPQGPRKPRLLSKQVPSPVGWSLRKERPAGVGPALPPWQGGTLPLHHGREREKIRRSDRHFLTNPEAVAKPVSSPGN